MQFKAQVSRMIALISMAAWLGACAAGPTPTPPPPAPAPEGPTVPSVDPLAPYQSSGHAGLDAWRIDFASRAAAQGRDPAVIRAVLEDLSPIDRFLNPTLSVAGTGIGDQAEFAEPIWVYLDKRVNGTRIERGREALAAETALFDSLEARHGVDRHVLAAIWGMETNYGGFIGSDDAANTLANMAVEGRRTRFAEGELIALMKVLESGLAERGELVSGWAGAMGQTQFMPSTYLAHAVDHDGDGRINVWQSKADALASAANYLAISGYRAGEPWGIEVIVPGGFDFGLADGQQRRVSTWQGLGLSPIRGGAFETGGAEFAELWLPAGATGPKYLLFKNFDVFKTYNRADSYALAVGVLANEVVGAGGPVTPWPRDITPLSVADIKTLQAGLNMLGHDAGAVDGIAGRGTRAALRRFQKAQGLPADGYPTPAMLDAVNAARGA